MTPSANGKNHPSLFPSDRQLSMPKLAPSILLAFALKPSSHLYYYIGEFGWSTRTSHRTNSGLYSTMSYVCTLGCPYVQDILYKPKSTCFAWHYTTPGAQERTTTIPDPSYPVIYLSLSVLLPPLQVSQVKYLSFCRSDCMAF